MDHAGVIGCRIVALRVMDWAVRGMTPTYAGLNHSEHKTATNLVARGGAGDNARDTVDAVTHLATGIVDYTWHRVRSRLGIVRGFPVVRDILAPVCHPLFRVVVFVVRVDCRTSGGLRFLLSK
jgi:hypothetical protein